MLRPAIIMDLTLLFLVIHGYHEELAYRLMWHSLVT